MVIWPQIVMIIYFALNFGIMITELAAGKTKGQLMFAMVHLLLILILYAGGFWNVLLNGPALGRFL